MNENSIIFISFFVYLNPVLEIFECFSRILVVGCL